jgi:DNA-binding NarL/FixJ family response regulator
MMNIEQNVPAAAQKPKSGRKPVDFDVAEALRLRRMGWSDRRIARHMHVAPGTVGSRLREWKPAPGQPPADTLQDPSMRRPV